MKSLFIMDPLDTIHLETDSTYLLMCASQERGFPVFYCTIHDIDIHNGIVMGRVSKVTLHTEAPHFTTEKPIHMPLSEMDVVWMRKDPPVDMAYILCTYLLDIVAKETLVVNHPTALRNLHEKCWAMHFRDIHPPTFMSSNISRLKEHIEKEPGAVVLKPWDGNAGRGVIVTRASDRNLNALLETMTTQGKQAIIVQPYLDAVEETGDKRIILFDGEFAGVLSRRPGPRDFRSNLAAGGNAYACVLLPEEEEICKKLSPLLKREGLIFVGIDVIGGRLTEINTTSPTGLAVMNRLYGRRMEFTLLDCVIQKHKEYRCSSGS